MIHQNSLGIAIKPLRLSSTLSTSKIRTPQFLRKQRAIFIKCQVEGQEQEESQIEPAVDVCPTCGVKAENIPNGCDRTGRIAGGLGAIAGFEWWPIKAYRPCPELTKSGKSYSRKGQVTDEMLFGKGYRK
eukprot:TRINITY_DN28901_c0_g1_i1.p2 TRINITY_DN28901_c0_g1~~TRINITY_DN28901_c0_g1_i1.p2  ORF type:complete len:130 (-),score=10.20 TRINITY_DN28901_c0_g1_i1:355-744(-)